jgi:hypothetical protein
VSNREADAQLSCAPARVPYIKVARAHVCTRPGRRNTISFVFNSVRDQGQGICDAACCGACHSRTCIKGLPLLQFPQVGQLLPPAFAMGRTMECTAAQAEQPQERSDRGYAAVVCLKETKGGPLRMVWRKTSRCCKVCALAVVRSARRVSRNPPVMYVRMGTAIWRHEVTAGVRCQMCVQ